MLRHGASGTGAQCILEQGVAVHRRHLAVTGLHRRGEWRLPFLEVAGLGGTSPLFLEVDAFLACPTDAVHGLTPGQDSHRELTVSHTVGQYVEQITRRVAPRRECEPSHGARQVRRRRSGRNEIVIGPGNGVNHGQGRHVSGGHVRIGQRRMNGIAQQMDGLLGLPAPIEFGIKTRTPTNLANTHHHCERSRGHPPSPGNSPRRDAGAPR